MVKIRLLLGVSFVALAIGLWFALTAPLDTFQGIYSRILHIHAPSAWIAFLAFGVTAVGSVGWRITRRDRWDRVALASAELGVLFTAIALMTGSFWGRGVWGTYFDWADPRMATTALMFFVYVGYLALRGASPDHETAAARASILGIIAVIQVPIVYFSVNLARGLHQTQSIRPDGVTMPTGMLVAMLINLAAFTFVYVALMMARTHLLREEAARDTADEVAGAGIVTPRIAREATDG